MRRTRTMGKGMIVLLGLMIVSQVLEPRCWPNRRRRRRS